jgi:hypothetical protein
MDLEAAIEKVAQWCAEQTAAGDPDAVEVECHAILCITIGECAPPWRVRYERRSSAGVSSPLAQLRYETVRDEWTLHHGRTPDGWCSHDDAVHAREVESLLTEVERDADGRFRRLPARIWPWD